MGFLGRSTFEPFGRYGHDSGGFPYQSLVPEGRVFLDNSKLTNGEGDTKTTGFFLSEARDTNKRTLLVFGVGSPTLKTYTPDDFGGRSIRTDFRDPHI